MNRDDVLLTRKYTKIHLGTLLDNYGPELLAAMIPSVYTFQYPEIIQRMGNHTTTYKNILRNWKNGRPWTHVSKTSGVLKKNYKGTNLKKILIQDFKKIERCLPSIHLNKNIQIIQKIFRRKFQEKTFSAVIIQKYARRFYVKLCKSKALQMIREGVDFSVDVITTEPLVNPCVILPDYNNGNCVFYNKCTIEKMIKSSNIPVFTYLNELTQQEEMIYRYVIERDMFGNILYKSPFTRNDFTMNDVLSLKQNLIFDFGQRLTYFQNRM